MGEYMPGVGDRVRWHEWDAEWWLDVQHVTDEHVYGVDNDGEPSAFHLTDRSGESGWERVERPIHNTILWNQRPMSGGSYNYAYRHVSMMAAALASSDDVLRRAFAEHLHLVADAMHDIEWVDSRDSASGSEINAIRKVIEHEHIDRALRWQLMSTARAILRTYETGDT